MASIGPLLDLTSKLRCGGAELKSYSSVDAWIAREIARRQGSPLPLPSTLVDMITGAESLLPELASRHQNTLLLRCLLQKLQAEDFVGAVKVREELMPRLEALCDRLQYGAGKQGAMTAKEANRKAMDLAESDPSFVHRSQREWAKAIGCSVGLVSKLQLWKETMRRSERQRKRRSAKPKAVSLTPALEAVAGEGQRDEVLAQLVAQQKADDEPSPLEDDPPGQPRRVRSHRRV